MTRVKKLALAALTALALAAAAVAATPTINIAGDPSQWGVAKKGSFDITEATVDGESVARKGSFDITEADADEVALVRGAGSGTSMMRIPPTCPDGTPEPCDGDELARNINEYEAELTADAGDPSQWG